MELNDLVHVSEIDADASIRCREIALQRGASRERNNRHFVLVTDLGDLGDFCSGFWVGYRYWKTINIGRGPLRIAVGFEVFGIERNSLFISRCGADVSDRLEALLALVLKTRKPSKIHPSITGISSRLERDGKGISDGPAIPPLSQQADDCAGGTSVPNRQKTPQVEEKNRPA